MGGGIFYFYFYKAKNVRPRC